LLKFKSIPGGAVNFAFEFYFAPYFWTAFWQNLHKFNTKFAAVKFAF